jgi:predicted nucleic acid-binding protein
VSRRDVLLDAGPLVAALDRRDQWHTRCLETWPQLLDRCLTTEAVVAEASHLILRGRGRASAPLEFLLEAEIPIVTLDVASHARAIRLMRRYEDLPMDYGDATLVATAEALGVTEVFTTDRRGFATYAPPRGSKFLVHPD